MGSPYLTQGGPASGSAYSGSGTPGPPRPAHGFLHDVGVVAGDLNPARLVHPLAGLGQAGYDFGKVVVQGDVGVLTGNQRKQQQASDVVGAYTKAAAKDLGTRYGPLAHGHVGTFAGQFAHDPLSYLLDAATVATLGAGGAAKGGELLAKAGAISKESRLANLGRPVEIAVPDWRGEAVTIKQSSANPLIRARQVATNRLLGGVAENVPVVGQSARLVKVLARPAERAAARLRLQGVPFEQAFARLSPEEKAAWHMSARGLEPAGYRAFIAQHPDASPAMVKLLDRPNVGALVANPTPRLQDALEKGRALSDLMTGTKLEQGQISEQAAAEAPYRTLRLMSGARIVAPEQAAAAPSLVHAVAERDQLASLHERALNSEAQWVHETEAGTLTAPQTMSDAQAHARLAELDAQHAALVERILPEVSPWGPQVKGSIAKREQMWRNYANSKPAGAKLPTVKEEERAIADQRLHEIAAANAATDAGAARIHAMLTEREQLRQGLAASGESTIFGGPETRPIGRVRLPAASNPYRDRIVKLGTKLEEAQARVDRMLASPDVQKASEAGVVGGKPIEQIAGELAAAGRAQPFYVPDSAAVRGGRVGRFASRPTGLAEPGALRSSRQNLGVLASRGMLNVAEDPLSREFGLLANRTEGAVLHDELVKHAGELPKGEPLPVGWDYLKLHRGEPAAPYLEQATAPFEQALEPGSADRFLTRDPNDPAIATRNENRLVVPSTVRKILSDQSLTTNGRLHKLLYDLPTSVWKHLVLGLRPAFFANITVGNSILGALQMAPGRFGVQGWLNQVVPGAEKLLGPKLTAETMEHVFPEQAGGTFGGTMGFTGGRGRNLAARAYQGVMPATIAYENVLRRAMAEGWASSQSEVRAATRAHGGDINAALRDVAQTHPHLVDEISRRIDDALGNYRRYNKLEQAIKQLIPFYGWDRHIVRSMARLLLERPALVDSLLAAGAVGNQRREQQLGAVPAYGEPWVRLPGLPAVMGPLAGRTPVLNTKSLNPFNSIVELSRLPQALTGVAGGAGSEELSSGLNPLVGGLIEQTTGRSLLSGAPLHQNAWVNAVENLPQVSLLQALRGEGKPTKPTSLYQNDLPTLLGTLLGVPTKKVNLQTAHYRAATGG